MCDNHRGAIFESAAAYRRLRIAISPSFPIPAALSLFPGLFFRTLSYPFSPFWAYKGEAGAKRGKGQARAEKGAGTSRDGRGGDAGLGVKGVDCYANRAGLPWPGRIGRTGSRFLTHLGRGRVKGK